MDKSERVELLSPAGDMECLIAALAAGADAVYLGLNRYSARALAANFTEDELLRALDIAHLHDAKIYLTVNTLFRDSEIEELYD
ncbi:MAG: U32 family peptidase, partial [Lachnospiraceae bacterium]|nr:U32 family peptidase [Lachnospiraceae bacterium]